MPNSCAACGAPSVRTYSISRGSLRRIMPLCREHSAPIETLLRLTATKTRTGGFALTPLEELKPSRAILARARATGSAPTRPRKAR